MRYTLESVPIHGHLASVVMMVTVEVTARSLAHLVEVLAGHRASAHRIVDGLELLMVFGVGQVDALITSHIVRDDFAHRHIVRHLQVTAIIRVDSPCDIQWHLRRLRILPTLAQVIGTWLLVHHGLHRRVATLVQRVL